MNPMTTDTATMVETPSGKGAGDENFPVGSFLIPSDLRPAVHAFYAFARAADDIADNPSLSETDKLARLDAFEDGLDGKGPVTKSHALAKVLSARGVPDRHARDLLAAFRQDAVQNRYSDWDALLGYCRLSANPVGRFLMDLHGEDPRLYGPSDALCTVLQILNHLQDVRDDLLAMDRCYIPLGWLAEEGLGVDALGRERAEPGVRRIIDRCLERCDALIAEAAVRPTRITSRRLNAEMCIITDLARRLAARLRAQDPLAGRVKLSKLDFAASALAGLGGLVSGRG